MATSVYDIKKLAAGHVLPVLPEALAKLQLQSKQTRVAAPGEFAVSDDGITAGDSTLNSQPVLYNEEQVAALKYSMFGTPMVQPLEISIDGSSEYWLLPIEPIITIDGGHEMIRRKVTKSKYRGTVKERWSQDDYSIRIDGIFRGKNQYTYPVADVKQMRDVCEARKVLFVRCPLFQLFNINQIVIEKFTFPFTKGDDMQAYSLTGYSDDQFQLLIKLE